MQPVRHFCIVASVYLVLSVLPTASDAAQITVGPTGDYSLIQDAIDNATHGDEIIVSPGTYLENINLSGENVHLRSTNPTDRAVVASTVIDGGSAGTVVTFGGTEDDTCHLSGFTITNGYSISAAGISGRGCTATIQYNVIIGNWAYGTLMYGVGGGLHGCDGLIHHNLIADNTAERFGGGLYNCDGTIEFNTIDNNNALDNGGGFNMCSGLIQSNTVSNNIAHRGGGFDECDAQILNNLITGNSAYEGGGLHNCAGIENNTITYNSATNGGGLSDCGGVRKNFILYNTGEHGGGLYECYPRNNIIAFNDADYGGGLYSCHYILHNTIYGNSAQYEGGGVYDPHNNFVNSILWANTAPTGPQAAALSFNPSHCCIQGWSGGGEGNITDNPQLVDPGGLDFHLQLTSPCIDAGDPYSDEEDFDGEARPYGPAPDIGADEVPIGSPPVPTPTPTPLPSPLPTSPNLDTWLDDHFDGSGLNTGNWEVTSGGTPTVSGSRAFLSGSTIRTRQAYRGIPLWLEVIGASYNSMADGSGVSIGLRPTLGGTCDLGMFRDGTTYTLAYSWSWGSSEGLSLLDFVSYLPTTPFDVTFVINEQGALLFQNGYYITTMPYMTATYSDYRLRLEAESGASFYVDRVRVSEEITSNPAYRLVNPSAANAFSLGDTGVSMTIDNDSVSYGYVKVERVDETHPGYPTLCLPYYWRIKGMDSLSFSADIVFSYSPSDVSSLGIAETDLWLYRSGDNGASWYWVPGTLDTANHRFTATSVTDFSLWLLAQPPTTGVLGGWSRYR